MAGAHRAGARARPPGRGRRWERASPSTSRSARGGGAYICGEETALLESIEGRRGEPRNKPPFPVEVGLFGRPTVINNVETLVNVPGILLDGGTEYAALGTEASSGHKLFSISGHVARPGVYEVEFGITLRDLHRARGRRPGRARRQGRQPGRRGGAFVGPEAMDMPLTFEHAKAIGATLGAGRRRRVRRDHRPRRTSCGGSPRSSATSPAASASRAGWARSARRSCSRGSRRGGPTGPSRTSSRCSRTSGR